MNPSVSVIIPLFNKAQYIGAAIDSVLRQQAAGVEVLVIDDCSTDNSVDVVQAYQDPRIRLFRQERNQGVSEARNRGIAEARSDWIAFLDADDEWKDDFLESIFTLQTNFPGCDAYATSYELIDNATRLVSFPIQKSFPQGWSGILEDLCRVRRDSSLFCTNSIVIKRGTLVKIGGFPRQTSHGEDVFVWIKLSLYYSIAFLNQPKVKYRQGVQNQLTRTSSTVAEIDCLMNLWKSLVVPEKCIKSFQCFLAGNTIQTARDMIVRNHDGKFARKIINRIDPIIISDFPQIVWLYFWSFFPGLFVFFNNLKIKIKNLFILG